VCRFIEVRISVFTSVYFPQRSCVVAGFLNPILFTESRHRNASVERVVRIRAGVLTVAVTAIINQPQIEGLDSVGCMVLRI
jgi:hypothetical protein